VGGGEGGERVAHRFERLVAADRPRRRDSALSQEPDGREHRLFRIAPLLFLVVRQKVEMGDANGYDEMDANGAIEARVGFMTETYRAARRVRDDEKPPIAVEGNRRRRGADTHPR
jgi:hypothetical protein